jgi:hypothetical protein
LPRPAVRRLFEIALLAALALLVASALQAGWSRRAGLRIVFGPLFYAWLAGALLAAGLLLRAAWRWRSGSEPRPGGRGLLAALFVSIVLGALVHVLCLQPYRPLLAHLYAAVWAGALPAWMLLQPSLLRTLGPRAGRVIAILLLEACALLVASELGLRALAVLRPSPLFALARQSSRAFLEQNRLAPGTLLWGFPVNSAGHCDEEFEPRGETPLVVTIGDSFSYGAVPHAFHFTTVCERLIPGLCVANMGVAAIGPPEYLQILTEEALPLEPDLVVISIFVGNDIAFLGRDVYGGRSWLRTLLDSESLLTANVPGRVLRLWRERNARRQETGSGASVDTGERPIDDPEELLATWNWLADPLLEEPALSIDSFLGVELARARELCASDEELYAPFFSVLAKIREAAGDRKLAVLLIPDEFQVEDELWKTVEERLPEELERDRPQRLITAWLDRHGVAYEDLLPRLRALPALADGRRHAYRLQETHFNVVGNRVAGEGLAALVERSMH